MGATSCGGGAGVVTPWAGVEGLEGSAAGVLVGWAWRDEALAGVLGATPFADPEGDCPSCLPDRRPPLRPLVLECWPCCARFRFSGRCGDGRFVVSSWEYCRSGRLRLLLLPGAIAEEACRKATSWRRDVGCRYHAQASSCVKVAYCCH